MNPKKLIVVVSTLIATNLYAQANFEGLSGGVNLGLANA